MFGSTFTALSVKVRSEGKQEKIDTIDNNNNNSNSNNINNSSNNSNNNNIINNNNNNSNSNSNNNNNNSNSNNNNSGNNSNNNNNNIINNINISNRNSNNNNNYNINDNIVVIITIITTIIITIVIITTNSNIAYIIYLNTSNYLILVRPTFKEKPPTSKGVFRHQKVTVSCSAVGDPVPTITWTKPDQNQSTTQGTSAELMVQSFDVVDEGNYTCIAENALGSKVMAVVKLCECSKLSSFVT